MNAPAPLPQTPHPAVGVACALDAILSDLLRLLNLRHALFGAIFILLSNRVSRARRRLVRLFTALAAGRLPRPRAATTPARPGGKAPAHIPRRRAWLLAIIGYQAAGYASQLQQLLDDPATRAMLDAAPPQVTAAAARTLRPLCRLLGVTLPPILQPPPRPARPKPERPKPPRPKPPALPPLLPLYPQSRPRDWPFMRFPARKTVAKIRPA